eukprot:Sdes_comp20372_c0_seq1m14214
MEELEEDFLEESQKPLSHRIIDNTFELKTLLNRGIFYAAKTGQLKSLRIFLEHGFELNQEDRKGRTVLYYIVFYRHFNILSYLLNSLKYQKQLKYSPEVTYGPKRCTLLHIACRAGNVPVIMWLLSLRCSVTGNFLYDVNCQDSRKSTPLLYACFSRFHRLSTIEFLLAHGANPFFYDQDGNSALHRLSCKHYSNFEVYFCIREILNAIKPNYHCVVEAVGERFRDFYPRYLELIGGDAGSKADPVKKKQKVSFSKDASCVSILDSFQCRTRFNALVENCAQDADFFATLAPKSSADEAHSNPSEICSWLLVQFVNQKNAHQDTALHKACRYSCWPSLQILLDHGADVNARNEMGDTPLLCLFDCYFQIGEHFSAPNSDSSDAEDLYSSASLEHNSVLKCVSIMLKYCANLSLRNSQGLSILELPWIAEFPKSKRRIRKIMKASSWKMNSKHSSVEPQQFPYMLKEYCIKYIRQNMYRENIQKYQSFLPAELYATLHSKFISFGYHPNFQVKGSNQLQTE